MLRCTCFLARWSCVPRENWTVSQSPLGNLATLKAWLSAVVTCLERLVLSARRGAKLSPRPRPLTSPPRPQPRPPLPRPRPSTKDTLRWFFLRSSIEDLNSKRCSCAFSKLLRTPAVSALIDKTAASYYPVLMPLVSILNFYQSLKIIEAVVILEFCRDMVVRLVSVYVLKNPPCLGITVVEEAEDIRLVLCV